ncbi:cAMP-binding domain of CRP or a regulatory subunit of cAMP-dependent protein kinases [Pedobacter westerhofensis]|uniref:cAMP-binding domain of CRP or a regulatory subunit of cAMP-dependent protein kinases n=1 Tax=Pedobacter westerhofensis TaxID=425512 RepID=A0A521AV33_9SPHI|nr:Crp/Fnr family transcriptional regulator [Pedobacter westerhofensis]SMO38581.1 cAMP-binding domain of CRP or a regulatory subunit of cAMP-dependent protein kinases [Pedobacter westerhofensis]
MDAIFKYFDLFLKLSPESKQLIADHLEPSTVSKGEYLWKAGQRCNSIYFITSGIARLFFYTEAGTENTVHFITENKFITDLESLRDQIPSSVSCIAAIDCNVFVITSQILEKLENNVPEWHELLKKITEKTLFDKIKAREILFQKESKERYISFLKLFPTVANSVPANQVASYLGISQFTLSHLKKEIASNDFLRIRKN